ncbi:MAG TPA: protealysin inhibitor emfourin [Microbacterium sp.]|uniref:protealysin inhibitor emfourin n=1 Tax=Microbacterium sp. TaxID=51671 RepID=UPI002C72E20D|nr:protealysin inhibitor emfourin [Microbacterium sp.]HWI31256.1 protealysin inhibitor emfourin [Microbacterium sp.]
MSSPNPDDGQATTSAIVVIVVRTGGIAGVRREWRAEPPPKEEPRWIALIEECPWDSATVGQGGADRFVWNIEAHRGPEAKEAKLPDRAVQGPWRELVDEVRSFDKPAPSPSPKGRRIEQ